MDNAKLGAELRKHILWSQDVEKATSEKTEESSAIMLGAGYRIVTSSMSEFGYWEIRDADTGELLQSGVGEESYNEAGDDHWVNEDAAFEWSVKVVDESPLFANHDSALPESLRDLLYDWANFYPDDVMELLAD